MTKAKGRLLGTRPPVGVSAPGSMLLLASWKKAFPNKGKGDKGKGEQAGQGKVRPSPAVPREDHPLYKKQEYGALCPRILASSPVLLA